MKLFSISIAFFLASLPNIVEGRIQTTEQRLQQQQQGNVDKVPMSTEVVPPLPVSLMKGNPHESNEGQQTRELSSAATSSTRIQAVNFSDQYGTTLVGNGAYVGDFNDGDHLIFSSIDFGSAGTTKSIKIRYAKYFGGGKLQVRLGDRQGSIIAEYEPLSTYSAYTFQNAHISLDSDVGGVHDLYLVGVFEGNANSIMDIEWFELSTFDQNQGQLLSRVEALSYVAQKGTYNFEGQYIRQTNGNTFHVEYENVNFGPRGTTKSIKIRYFKDIASARLEIRIGRGTTGPLIGALEPEWTGMSGFTTVNIEVLDDVEGIQDLTITVNKKVNFALDWFQLSDETSFTPLVPATTFSDEQGTSIDNRWGQYIESFGDNDYLTYSNIDFGPTIGTTRSIKIGFNKQSDIGGKLEFRLGGPSGLLIGEFFPSQKYGPGSARGPIYRTEHVAIDDAVTGIHNLTIIAKHQDNVLTFNWFQLSPDYMYDNWAPYGKLPAIYHDVGPRSKYTGLPSDSSAGGPIAMSADAHTIVVGTGWISHNSMYREMSVYRYDIGTGLWNKLGSTIDGLKYLENKGTTFFGRNVAISNNGNRIVVGTSTRPGEVTVLDYDHTIEDWGQVGNTIVGPNIAGRTVSISGTGSRIFVGSPSYFQVYEQDKEGDWADVGGKIQTDSQRSEGCSSISDDGTRIAIGDQAANNNFGKITVYDLVDGVWQSIFNVNGEFERDHVGWGTCSLSGDGLTLVSIGLNLQHRPNEERVGKVRIYRVKSSASSATDWRQIGGDIFGPSWWETNRANVFGKDTAGAINFDGNVVAIGALGANFVRVYKYDDKQNVWVRIGRDIFGASMQDQQFSRGLAMSHDGSKLAVSSYGSRNVYVYENNDALSTPVDPTDSPSDLPSVTPTASPSVTPTTSPSATPSASPSKTPSTIPSANPSSSPSVTPTASPSFTPSASPSTIPSTLPTITPVAFDFSYTFPPVELKYDEDQTSFIHGICVMEATEEVSATSTNTDQTYTSVPDFQNNMKLWGNRGYVAGSIRSDYSNMGIVGDEMCQGGTYLRPAKHGESVEGTKITVHASSYNESVTVCAFVTPESRAGRWDQTLPAAGFQRSTVRFQWHAHGHERPYMYCKGLKIESNIPPSVTASASPSVTASASPSVTPSASPSKTPSTIPSANKPSASPSDAPSMSSGPSASPSEAPSLSDLPSARPSDSPSISAKPSASPSGIPSVSAQPSVSPSDVPSVSSRPSSSPSDSPSISSGPSSSPSDVPSLSSRPSASPSDAPSMSSGPSVSPSDVPSLTPSAAPIPVPAPAIYQYVFPPTDSSQFVHGICALGASTVNASSSTPTVLSYKSLPNFQNGVKLWEDRTYTAGGVNGDQNCQGGIYLQPSKHKAINRGTVIMFEGTPKSGSSITLCALVSNDDRNGKWNEKLPADGFVASSTTMNWFRSYCKTLP